MPKVALVVGGGKSLGEYLSKHLAKEGYDVAVADINYENAFKVAKEIEKECPVRTVPVKVDATDEEQVKNMVDLVYEKLGSIDLLVYNAGYAKSNKIDQFSLADFNVSVNINLTGYFLCAREVSKLMINLKKPGSIIQINSKSGKVGSKYNSGYSSAKFGAVGLTQSLALDLAEHHIRVNSLMLGNLLDSEMFESLIPQYAKKLGIEETEVKNHYIDKVPLRRGCTFKDVAEVLTFYASEKADYLTGQSINVTGGQVMH